MSTKIDIVTLAARAAAGEKLDGSDVARLGEAVIAFLAEQTELRSMLERCWQIGGTENAPLIEHVARLLSRVKLDHDERCPVIVAKLRAAQAREQVQDEELARLRAEAEQVRRYIASSKEVAEAGAAEKYEQLYDDLRDRCTTAMDALAENATINIGTCPFCGEAWPTNGCDRARRAAIAATHDSTCPKNPIRIERDALRTALIGIATLQIRMRRDAITAWATRETANDLSEPFSAARVEALLAEELEGEPAP